MNTRLALESILNKKNVNCAIDDEKIIRWGESSDQPTQEEINVKITELQNAEPMRLLRQERDRRITETDWWAGQDLTMTQDQKDYRQTLRDLPSTASPRIENGVLTNVTWPTKPE